MHNLNINIKFFLKWYVKERSKFRTQIHSIGIAMKKKSLYRATAVSLFYLKMPKLHCMYNE